MKKKILWITVLVLVLNGCSVDKVFKINNNTIEENLDGQDYSSEEKENMEKDVGIERPIEEDVNAEDLEEDEKLTQQAQEKHRTEEDILLPQEEVNKEEEVKPGDGDGQNENPTNSEDGEIQEPKDEYEVLRVFSTELPSEITLNLKYDRYPTSYNYLLILYPRVNIREKPTTESRILRNAVLFEKINLNEEVKGQYLEEYKSDIWYKVLWKENDEIKYGYVFSSLAEPREFQFEKMLESIKILKNEVENNRTAYISNYKNRKGRAPLYKGNTEDKYGVPRYQSAPAYLEPNFESEFRYISDGTIVSVSDEKEGFYRIKTLNFEGEYWVPKKYISFYNSIEELKKVIVVDRKNQNEGVFEYEDGKWNLISYIFATTGEKAKYKQETSLGYYMVMEKRSKFLYLDDVTREISGYAPYTIRFNGGAYIHGVPVEFDIVEGERVDPGMQEYLFTIGTVPRSHKCVRNYTSHAKFLYDWIEIGKSAVIVIE